MKMSNTLTDCLTEALTEALERDLEKFNQAFCEEMKKVELSNAVEVFKKTYDGESIVDIDRDVSEALDTDIGVIPTDRYGFRQGTFTVTIEWKPEES